jgi:hypothetical protein
MDFDPATLPGRRKTIRPLMNFGWSFNVNHIAPTSLTKKGFTG